VLQAVGDQAEARALADAARATARRLGAEPLLAELRALGGPGARRASGPGAAHQALTARESEILKLVADGRSNGEIGKQLFISTKTVSVHVSNILAKLGASGRTEAAAIARRQGLV
jgi:DNA-binding NarL/FixJ family response regulator